MDIIKLKELIDPMEYIGSDNIEIAKVVALDSNEHSADSLTWVNENNLDKLKNLSKTSLILPHSAFDDNDLISQLKNNNVNLFFTKKPRLSFSNILKEMAKSKKRNEGIEKSAVIHPGASIGKGCYIGNNVVIEEGCRVGNDCVILHNTVIFQGTVIGNNVSIGSNCTIAGVGFGYELNDSGEYELLPHLGNVEIKDNVEIGNNTSIDRAVLGSTVIGFNVKIDNLVHIAHGVKIGDNSLIIANSMIAGSTVIESDVWVAPSVSVLNKLNIGKGSLIGMGAVVLKNVKDNSIIAGNPGKFLKNRNE